MRPEDKVPTFIRQSWLDSLDILSVEAAVPGMSGACVYRCKSKSDECMALKRWPLGVQRRRIVEIHQAMTHALERGCELVPRIVQAPTKSGQHYWDLTQWMPGQPLAKTAPLDLIRSGAGAIVQFHISTGPQIAERRESPAVIERLERLAELDRQLPLTLFDHALDWPADLQAAINRASQLLRWKWDNLRLQAARLLKQHADHRMQLRLVLRDVHREHVLFDNNQPSGLIDFDAIRNDAVATDFARWAGSGWRDQETGQLRPEEEVWNAILAGIGDVCSSMDGYFGETDLRLARLLYRVNPWISLGNWLIWLTVEQRQFLADSSVIAERISMLADLASANDWLE